MHILTETEETLVGIWSEILKAPGVGVHDDFFDLGGDSLAATRCINRIRTAFGVDVPLDAFFGNPAHIAAIASQVDQLRLDRPTGDAVERGVRQPIPLAIVAAATLLLPGPAPAQATHRATHYALESLEGLRVQHVSAEPSTLQGKKGVKVVLSEETVRQFERLTPEERVKSPLMQIVPIEGLTFSNGVITAEIAGDPAPGADPGARGFVGIAFRVQDDLRTYDAFYLRPTNGRAEDQERRNHAAQYISMPVWPWQRLRKETPSKYEAYVDILPGQWTRIKIDVQGDKARLYVNDQQQPTLIVNDVKSGANAKGAVALWLGPGAVAHYRDLTVEPAP